MVYHQQLTMLTEFLDRLVLVIGVSNNLRKWSPRAVDINWWRHLHSISYIITSRSVWSTDPRLLSLAQTTLIIDLDLQSSSALLVVLPTPLMATLMIAVFPTPRWRCMMSKQLIRSKRPQWCYINPAQAALKMLNIGNIAGKLTVDTQAFCSM